MNELNECVVESIIVDDWITGSEKRGSSFVHIDGERTCKEIFTYILCIYSIK